MTTEKKPLRSSNSYGRKDRDGFIHRSWMKSEGLPPDVFDGRPVIGICNTWSELTPCNAGLRDLADHVKRGVWEAGGLPLEFPAMSLGETQMRPTAMLFRNLLAMEVEESIRGNPIDAVVLLGGCDKTTPGQLMGAASVDLPTHRGLERPDAEREIPRAATSDLGPTCGSSARRCAPAKCRWMISWRPNPACRAPPAPA